MSSAHSATFRVADIDIVIEEGDLTKAQADAITNAANNRLFMGAGVAGAIKRAGGPEVEHDAVAKGPIPIGAAVETTAGRLPYKYVLHGAVMGTDLRTDASPHLAHHGLDPRACRPPRPRLHRPARLRHRRRRVRPARVRPPHGRGRR